MDQLQTRLEKASITKNEDGKDVAINNCGNTETTPCEVSTLHENHYLEASSFSYQNSM